MYAVQPHYPLDVLMEQILSHHLGHAVLHNHVLVASIVLMDYAVDKDFAQMELKLYQPLEVVFLIHHVHWDTCVSRQCVVFKECVLMVPLDYQIQQFVAKGSIVLVVTDV